MSRRAFSDFPYKDIQDILREFLEIEMSEELSRQPSRHTVQRTSNSIHRALALAAASFALLGHGGAEQQTLEPPVASAQGENPVVVSIVESSSIPNMVKIAVIKALLDVEPLHLYAETTEDRGETKIRFHSGFHSNLMALPFVKGVTIFVGIPNEARIREQIERLPLYVPQDAKSTDEVEVISVEKFRLAYREAHGRPSAKVYIGEQGQKDVQVYDSGAILFTVTPEVLNLL